MWGLTVEEASAPPVEIWPDNLVAFDVFSKITTQWNVGPSGASGLPYAVLPFIFEVSGIDREDWPFVFDDVQVMERAVLAHWAAQRDK